MPKKLKFSSHRPHTPIEESRIHNAAFLMAQADDSDPFSYGRIKSELLHHNCSVGLPSEVSETADTLTKMRERTAKFDPDAATKIKRALGLEV